MKIFELRWTKQDEKEWIAADTNIEALKKYCSITGMDLSDFDELDEIIEIPESEWDKFSVREEDREEAITFRQWMKENKYPDIIAGTMYE